MAICALIFCITQVQQTYAKYLDTKEGDTDFSVAQWKILVNNQDITEAATMSSLIHPIYLENENVKDGVIAPGQKDILILRSIQVRRKYHSHMLFKLLHQSKVPLRILQLPDTR